ncbi:hypothetical protein HDV06_005112 [Boothiomyces sp. JEL0866]|nr:hypothetical protein HDV06_005112 [Boothiomyces sp. JEL0866]
MQQKTFSTFSTTEGLFNGNRINEMNSTVTAQLDLSYSFPFNVHDFRAKLKSAVHRVYWENSMLRCCFTDNGEFTQFTQFKDPNSIIPVFLHESSNLNTVQEQLTNREININGPLWFVTIVSNPTSGVISILLTALPALLDVDSLYTVIDQILSKLDSSAPIAYEYANYQLFNFAFRPLMHTQLLKWTWFNGYFDACKLYRDELYTRISENRKRTVVQQKTLENNSIEKYQGKVATTYPMEYDNVLKIVETARHEGTTLTGILNAAALSALVKTFGIQKQKVAVYTMIDCRNHLHYKGLGSFSIFSFGAAVKSSLSYIWDIVHFTKSIVTPCNILSAVRANSYRGSRKYKPRSRFVESNCRNFVLTSNIGDISSKISREYYLKSCVLQVQSGTFFYRSPLLFLSATTCNGKLALGLTYPALSITDEEANRYLNNVREDMENLPSNPEPRTVPFLTVLLPIIFVFGVSFLKE